MRVVHQQRAKGNGLPIEAKLCQPIKELLNGSYENTVAVQKRLWQLRVSQASRNPKLFGLLSSLVNQKVVWTKIDCRASAFVQPCLQH
jgi:hypothetical protein